MHIRRAVQDESRLLSDLAYRSKGYWNYGNDYMVAARRDLTISPAEIVENHVFVLEHCKNIIGFYELKEQNSQETELLWLFIDPSAIGEGYGKKLWNHAVQAAWAGRYKRIKIKSDPYAERFYLKQGAQRVGEIPSTVQPDLMFPLLYLNRETLDDLC